MRKYIAELLGTMVLVLLGCGSAVFAGGVARNRNNRSSISFRFICCSYGILHRKHIRMPHKSGHYIRGMDERQDGYQRCVHVHCVPNYWSNNRSNDTGCPCKYGRTWRSDYDRCGETAQAFLAEAVFTFIFVLVVLGATDEKRGAGNMAGLAIGLTLALIHIVCIPITGTSVNPARSIGPAIMEGGQALSQLWLFIVAPLVGAAFSSLVWKFIGGGKR